MTAIVGTGGLMKSYGGRRGVVDVSARRLAGEDMGR